MMISKQRIMNWVGSQRGLNLWPIWNSETAGLRDVDADSTGSLSCSLGHDGPWGHNNKNVEFDGIWMPTMGYIHVYTPKWMEETMENLSVHGWCGVTAILTKPPYSDIESGTRWEFSPASWEKKQQHQTVWDQIYQEFKKTLAYMHWYRMICFCTCFILPYCPKYFWSLARVCTATYCNICTNGFNINPKHDNIQ